MKYILKFETVADFNAATIEKPNVSYIEETGEIHYLPDNIIDINDTAAKQILVQNFDFDGDGEISKEEALAVTSSIATTLSTNRNTAYTDFSWVQYFRNANFSSNYYFYGMSNCTVFNLDNCDISKCTDMQQWFGVCNKAATISMKNCDFSNVTKFTQMFNSSSGVPTINFSGA